MVRSETLSFDMISFVVAPIFTLPFTLPAPLAQSEIKAIISNCLLVGSDRFTLPFTLPNSSFTLPQSFYLIACAIWLVLFLRSYIPLLWMCRLVFDGILQSAIFYQWANVSAYK